MRDQKGFTFIELSIVLIIIGLLVQASIKGKEMIDASKSNNFVKDIQAIQIAYYNFHTNRGLFPGDSNGDRLIDYDAVGTDDGVFFKELYEAKLINSENAEVPLDNAGFYFVNFLSKGELPSLTNGVIPGKPQVCATEVEDKYARYLDNKVDEGIFNKGIVRSLSPYGTVERHTVCYQL